MVIMKSHFNLFKVTAALLLLLLPDKIFPQNENSNPDLMFNNQIKFSLAPVLYDNLQLTYEGERILKSRPCVSYDASISYHQHIKKGYGLNIGIGLTMAPFNHHFKFISPPNSIFQTGPYRDAYEYLDDNNYVYVQSLYTVPLSVQKIFPIKKKKEYFLSLEAGIRPNIIVAFPYWIEGESWYEINDSTEVHLFEFNLFDCGNKLLISYFLKFGFLKMTKNQNTLQCNLVVNYSPDKMGEGWYKFYNLTYDNYGKVKQNINYIGIEFTYGLTLSRRPRIK